MPGQKPGSGGRAVSRGPRGHQIGGPVPSVPNCCTNDCGEVEYAWGSVRTRRSTHGPAGKDFGVDTVVVGGQAPLPQYTVELEIYPRRQGYNGYHSTHPLRVDLDSGLGSSPSRRWLKEGKAVSTLPVGQWASGVRFGGCGALGRTRGRGGEVRVLGLTRGPPSRTRQAASCLTTQKAAKAGLLALVESSHKSGFPLLACAQPPSSPPP